MAPADKLKVLINGKLVDTADSFEVINPATGEVLANAPHTSQDLAEQAVVAANTAFAAWSITPVEERHAVLAKCSNVLTENKDELAELLTKEQGKPLAMAKGEIAGCIMLLDKASKLVAPVDVYEETETKRVEVRHVPIGVVVCLTPWNFPMFCSVQKWAPALALGNTCVWKPSPFTPLTNLRFSELLVDVIPAGVLNTVTGNDKSDFNLGAFLSNHPLVRKLSFTGSVATGKKVMASSVEDVKRVTLEMGGNDAAIIREDCDPKEVAAKVCKGAFGNTGQICCAIKRVFVHESIYDEFVAEAVKAAEATKIGDGFEAGVDLGPLNNSMQYNKVADLLEDAKSSGAEVRCGGKVDGPGFFFKPAVVTGVKEGVRLVDEEQFGPVLPIMSYKTDDEAVQRANATQFGLGGSVWSSDKETANAIASRIQAGTVWVNDHVSLTGAPFGGFKWSGFGRELGKEDIAAFTETQTFQLAK